MLSSKNSFQLAIIQIYVFLNLAIDREVFPGPFIEVVSRMRGIIHQLCSVISIHETADSVYQAVDLLEVNKVELEHPFHLKI